MLVNKLGWDGNWYRRAIMDDGNLILHIVGRRVAMVKVSYLNDFSGRF